MIAKDVGDVRADVESAVDELIDEYRDEPEIDRNTVIERMNEATDALFGNLVMHGRIDQYDAGDLARTAPACGLILQVAEADAWVEDDHGLWDGLTYGVLASIAYFSLRNLLYEGMKRKGYDTNDEYPFAKTADAE